MYTLQFFGCRGFFTSTLRLSFRWCSGEWRILGGERKTGGRVEARVSECGSVDMEREADRRLVVTIFGNTEMGGAGGNRAGKAVDDIRDWCVWFVCDVFLYALYVCSFCRVARLL